MLLTQNQKNKIHIQCALSVWSLLRATHTSASWAIACYQHIGSKKEKRKKEKKAAFEPKLNRTQVCCVWNWFLTHIFTPSPFVPFFLALFLSSIIIESWFPLQTFIFWMLCANCCCFIQWPNAFSVLCIVYMIEAIFYIVLCIIVCIAKPFSLEQTDMRSKFHTFTF